MDVSDLVAVPFRWGAALRGRRVFHPLGVLARGHLERMAPAHDGLPIASSEVLARVSKAAGTAGPLPDFVGLAVRVQSATPWDILVVSSDSGVLARALALRPTISWTGQSMTSLMPFGYRGRTWWLRAISRRWRGWR